MSKIYLVVSYDDKDEAKASGAKWDGAAKKWYFWQECNEALPASLSRFAPAGGAISEADINGQIASIIGGVKAGIPTAITAARASMASAQTKATDPMLVAAIAHMDTVTDEQITSAALDLLAAIASTDRQNLDRFLSGKSADPCRALMATFGGGKSATATDRLAALKGASADMLARETMRRIGQQFAVAKNAAEKEERKVEAVARAEAVIAQINPDDLDLSRESFAIGDHAITLCIGNMSWMYINTIDGRRDVVSSTGEYCAWLDQMDTVKALNDKLTAKWLAGVVDRSIPSSKFERQSAREAIAKRAAKVAAC